MAKIDLALKDLQNYLKKVDAAAKKLVTEAKAAAKAAPAKKPAAKKPPAKKPVKPAAPKPAIKPLLKK